jgi:hypothetical protein
VRPWLSAAALRALLALTSVGRIAVLRSSRSGELIETIPLNTKKRTPGIVWCTRAFICSRGLPRMTAFASMSLARILQIKISRSLPGDAEFVAYMDAIGEIDGVRCLIDWKTTTSRYPDGPEGLLSLDPQLICYSWISGISEVAFVVFVRKQVPEIQLSEDVDLGGAASGIRPAGRDNHQADRGRSVQSPQRDPVSAKRLRELFSSGALPEQRAANRSQPHTEGRSERP